MYIHQQIQAAVLPLLKQHDLTVLELIGEMNHAAWELSVLNADGLTMLEKQLSKSVEKCIAA